MNRNTLLAGTAIVALMASAVVSAAERADTQIASSESNEQMCARWAGNQNLQGAAQAEYVKDCMLDLRVPEKKEGGDGGD